MLFRDEHSCIYKVTVAPGIQTVATGASCPARVGSLFYDSQNYRQIVCSTRTNKVKLLHQYVQLKAEFKTAVSGTKPTAALRCGPLHEPGYT